MPKNLLPILVLVAIVNTAYSTYSSQGLEPDPLMISRQWWSPLEGPNRKSVKNHRVISSYGAFRSSYVKGHFHSASDLKSNDRNLESPTIFPVSHGVIISIHLDHPHKTIVLKHRMPNKSVIYTSYKHLAKIFVKEGDQVSPTTELGVLYTRSAAQRLGGNYDHLHFEVRKSFHDSGAASWTTMSRKNLDKIFMDPNIFLNVKLNNKKEVL